MSAGFDIADKVFWGTDGAVEVYVEIMADLATVRLGLDAPLTLFLRCERDRFQMGHIVFLDEWLANIEDRTYFLELLDAASEHLLKSSVFSEYGREWVTTVVTEMRDFIVGRSFS